MSGSGLPQITWQCYHLIYFRKKLEKEVEKDSIEKNFEFFQQGKIQQAQRRAATDRLAAKLELTKTSFNFLCFKNPNFRSPEKHEILHRHAQWFAVTIFKISKTKHKSLLFFSDFQRFLVNRKWFRRPFSDRHPKLIMHVGDYQEHNAKSQGRSAQQFLRNTAIKYSV